MRIRVGAVVCYCLVWLRFCGDESAVPASVRQVGQSRPFGKAQVQGAAVLEEDREAMIF